MREDDFNEEEVGESIAHGLVDEVDAGTENFKSLLLAWATRLMLLNSVECIGGEDDGSVTVGLEVDTNVELLSGMVQVLDTSGGAVNLELQCLFYILCSGSIGVGSLNNADSDALCESALANEIAQERGHERSNAITIEKTEDILRVLEVVDNAISITVERCATVTWSGL